MTLYRFDGKEPNVNERSYVSCSAEVIGNVEIGSQCYVGSGAKIRGDYGRIVIGNGTSIEEIVFYMLDPMRHVKLVG